MFSHTPQLQSCGGGEGCVTDPVAQADVKTAMITNTDIKYKDVERMFFIV